MGRDPVAVVNFLISSVLGFLSGLGVGGGSLLVLYLTLILGHAPEEARTINLLFFLPSAGFATLIHLRNGRLNLKKIFPAIAAGCTSAALVSWFGQNLKTEALQKLFGILLIITGLRELFYRSRKFK